MNAMSSADSASLELPLESTSPNRVSTDTSIAGSQP